MSDASLPPINQTLLSGPVRRALGSATVEVADWQCEVLHGGYGSASGGVYRVTGTGRDQGQTVPWSLVLKIVGTPRGDSALVASYFVDDSDSMPSGLHYWKREVLAYQSGLLSGLPACLGAPRCFDIVEQSDADVWLWLEEIRDCSAPRWDLPQYARAAYQLGCFQGAYLAGRPLPDAPWLSRAWTRGWVARAAQAIEQLPSVRNHPLVERICPPRVVEALLQLWAEREVLLDALDRLPPTLCHHDVWRRNLLVREMSSGSRQLVAIDWAGAGVGPVGDDLAHLVAASLDWFEVGMAQAQELAAATFTSYVNGLSNAGWRGDADLVRFGYAASMALRYGVGFVPVNLAFALDERNHAFVERTWGASIGEVMEHGGAVYHFICDHADEARRLLPNVKGMLASSDRRDLHHA